MSDTEKKVIEQLQSYKRIVARMKILEKYPIGTGLYLSTISADDNLQELHRKLRGLNSYMYLTQREQQLEVIAHDYVTGYPAGTRAQLRAVPSVGFDSEDTAQLREIRRKIEKVIETRSGGRVNDFDSVIERLSEMQDLRQELCRIDQALEALAEYKPEYARLLRLRYLEEQEADDVAAKLSINRSTFFRWRTKAVDEYAKLAGVS
jgi:hypothetical protein